jgi:hypothetical protein
MNVLRRFFSPLALFVAASVTFASVTAPAAHAAMVSTDALLRGEQSLQERAAVAAALERADVRDALVQYGVDPARVQSRVDGLSDAEIHALAGNLDSLPAGAGSDPLGILLFIFVLLLITDILGFTDVFPFVKKRAR